MPSNKRAANQLGITERTVKAHLTEIFRKLAVDDRVQLALLVAREAQGSRAPDGDSPETRVLSPMCTPTRDPLPSLAVLS